YTTWNPGVMNHPAVSALTCASCHETGNFQGMHPSTNTAAGDSRPPAALDRLHPATGDCSLCHNTTSFLDPTTPRPSNHVPTTALCSQCHTTAGNWALYSVTGVHQGVTSCLACHGPGTGPFAGPPPSNTITIVGWPGGNHIPIGRADCNGSGCHATTPTFVTNLRGTAPKPANHIPTTAPCAQCHTTAGNFALYSSPGTHQGVRGCVQCHGSSAFNIAANPVFTMMMKPGNHIPIGNVDCNGSGCHTTGNVTPGGGGFKLGNPSISAPTLNVAGHTTLAVVGTCASCHESAPYLGMMASTSTAAGDSRPNTTLDSKHPITGDCGNCHVTTPTFATDLLPTAGKPSNHIPTTAACAQCHTTAGNFALYSVTGTHQGVTGCLTCHGSTVAKTFANVTIVTTPSNHIPIGSLNCNGSGCHSTSNVNPGGFRIGAASVSAPTLSVAGHTTVAVVGACSTCHETAPYLGMVVSTATAWGDSRPQAFDKAHPASGDCNGCHTTSPTFATNQMGSSAKPANHIPTSAPCAQCHTTAGNLAAYVMGATGH